MANYLYLPDSPEPTIWNILDSKNPTGYTPYSSDNKSQMVAPLGAFDEMGRFRYSDALWQEILGLGLRGLSKN